MAVTKGEQTTEEVQQEQEDVRSKEDKISEELLSSLDLDLEEEKKPEEQNLEGGKVRPKELPTKDDQDEEDEDDQEKQEDEDEEVIPKSKFEKRLQSEVAKRKIAEARLQELEAAKTEKVSDRRSQLESMTQDQLKDLKKNARAEWKRTEDPERERQLDDLLDEIDDVVQNGPSRFQNAQVREYEKAVVEVQTDPENEGIDWDGEAAKIKEIAVGIYQRYPELQKLKTGQATALKMAVDHFRETVKVSKVKSKEERLKRQNTNLKRKTALDSSAIKGAMSQKNLKALRQKAKETNSFYDKEAYVSQLLDIDRYVS